MSIEMMTLVWHHSQNSGSVLLLELAIADHAHDDGTGAYPSNERLAIYARQGERNVRYIMQKLLQSKEVSILYNAGPHGVNLFEINTKLLRRLPDQLPTRKGAKIAGGQRLPPAKPRIEGGKIRHEGGKIAPEGGKIASFLRGQPVAP